MSAPPEGFQPPPLWAAETTYAGSSKGPRSDASGASSRAPTRPRQCSSLSRLSPAPSCALMITSGAVGRVVRAAADRAGLDAIYDHSLRHAAPARAALDRRFAARGTTSSTAARSAPISSTLILWMTPPLGATNGPRVRQRPHYQAPLDPRICRCRAGASSLGDHNSMTKTGPTGARRRAGAAPTAAIEHPAA